MSLIPIKLLCNRRPKSSSGSGSGSGSSSSGSGTTTNSAALPDWFYFNTEENSVHCKYPLVGDSEVSAFGYGSSSGSGGGGGGEIDPSVLENYVTYSYLDSKHYLSSADMSNYVTLSYLDSLDYETAITQLNAQMSGLAAQVQTNKNNLTAYDTRITTLETKVNSYINSYVYQVKELYAYIPILRYMELCVDNYGNSYIKIKCPIVSTGDIGAFEIG